MTSRPRAVIVALTLAGSAFAYEQTAVVPLLPFLRRELHTSTEWVTWLLTSFLLVATVAPPVVGRLADQYGKRRLLLISLGAFFVGTVGAVAAPDIWTLIGFRAVQGLGGAMFPLGIAIVKDEFPAQRFVTALGVVAASFAVGGSLGIGASGAIADLLSWRYTLALGALLTLAAALLVYLSVPESISRATGGVDVAGVFLLSVGLTCLLLAITEGSSQGWSSLLIVGLFAAATAALTAWVVVELHVDAPMVDMRMLVGRAVLLTNASTLIGSFPFAGIGILVSLFLASDRSRAGYGFGASATATGLYMLPSALAGLYSGVMAGRLGTRHGAKWPLALGMFLMSAASGLIIVWHGAAWQILLAFCLLGLGAPFGHAAVGALIMQGVRPTETAVAMGMNAVMRTLGTVVGGQVAAAILTSYTIGASRTPAERAFVVGFAACALSSAAAGAIALFVTPGRRASASSCDPESPRRGRRGSAVR